MQTNPVAALPAAPAAVQFYSVQLTPLADGHVSVAIGATLCEGIDEGDFELVNMDVASGRVATLDEALAVIREAVVTTLN
jgi:hypothetical protein